MSTQRNLNPEPGWGWDRGGTGDWNLVLVGGGEVFLYMYIFVDAPWYAYCHDTRGYDMTGRDGEMGRWRDGGMTRWRDGAIKQWRDGEMNR